MICEYCKKEHDGSYGSGRFCSEHCAKGFSTKDRREEINKKISKTLKTREDKFCQDCGKKLSFNNKSGFCNLCKTQIRDDKFCQICGAGVSYNNTSGFCKVCKSPGKVHSELVVEWRKRVKLKSIEYKGGGCVVCGYNRCVRSLHFHHVNPDEKLFNISHKNIHSWEKIKEELDKCILVCSNCHGEIESGLLLAENFLTNFKKNVIIS